MKDKEKEIKDICKLICVTCAQFDGCAINCKAHRDTAEALYNAGYRKLPKDSVVLSREEYERITKELVTEQRATEIAKEYFEKMRKETAEKDFNTIVKALEERKGIVEAFYGVAESVGVDIAIRTIKELAKQFSVEIKEDKNV